MNCRKRSALAALLLVSLFLAGCSEKADDGVFVVREKVFASTIKDMYLNTDAYVGKTIRLEGMMLNGTYGEEEEPYKYVYRYGPGCCSNDAVLGLEVAWTDGQEHEFPEDGAWVEAVGTLETYLENGTQYLRLDLQELNVLEKRGKETVNN